MEVVTAGFRPEMLSMPVEWIYPWALDQQKTHIVQLYIAKANPDEAIMAMMLGLKGNVISCIHSQHGNYVIQKIITQFPLASLDWLLDELCKKEDILDLIKHKYGCRIFCRLFEKSNEDDLPLIWESILENIDCLIAHNFGCYPLTTYVLAYNAQTLRGSKHKINIILAHLLGVQPLYIWKKAAVSLLAEALLQNDGELEETLALALNSCLLVNVDLTKRRHVLLMAVGKQMTNTLLAMQPDVPQQMLPEGTKKIPENMSPIAPATTHLSVAAQKKQIWTCEQVEKSFGLDGSKPGQLVMYMVMPPDTDAGMPMYWAAFPCGPNMNNLEQTRCWG